MNKLYFRDKESCYCYPLKGYIEEARLDCLEEIELIEAVRAKGGEFVWCSLYGHTLERSDCRKSECQDYERDSDSNSRICTYRECCYEPGKSVIFKVKDY